MSRVNNTPPRLADWVLERLCKDEWIEPIQGDLFEQYQIDRVTKSRLKSNCLYWIHMLNFLRPFALKRNITISNHTAMLKNIFKSFFRQLVKKPSHQIINILGLSLGLTVVFLSLLWIEYHQSFDRFHKKSDRTYSLLTNNYSSGETQTATGAVLELTKQAEANIAGIENMTRLIANWRWPSEQCFKIEENQPCIYSKGIFADEDFFKIFDFKIIHGEDNPLLAPNNIALSRSLAKKLYGHDNPVGEEYLVDNHHKVIIAAIFEDVRPTSSLQFEFIAPLDLAYTLWGQKEERMQQYSFITYLTLNNANPLLVEEQINQLPAAAKYENSSVILHPFKDLHLYNDFQNGKASGGLISYINIIGLFAVFILVMSMVNFINLTTAQSSLRGKEIGIRKVNGASTSSLHFQFLIETSLKVTLATAVALISTYLLLPLVNRLTSEQMQFDLDLPFLLQLLGIVAISSLLSGIYPALVLSKFNPIRVLKNLPFKSGGKQQIRKWLTITQISISGVIVLLTCTFYLQLKHMQESSSGYDRKGILIMEPTFSHIRSYPAFEKALTESPLVSSIGACNANMIAADYISDQVSWKGKTDIEQIQFKPIGAENGLIDVFGLSIVEGTHFSENDSLNQVILTRGAVDRMGLENPIGQSIDLWGTENKIVGIVEDFNTESLHESLIPVIIYKVLPQYTGTFYIRYDQHRPKESIAHIEKVYDEFEPFFNMKSKILDDEYAKLYKEEQVISNISILVMIIAFVIAMIGILGLSTFNTVRRYKEVGLRKIFGASGSQIIQTLSLEFVWVAFIANLIAWPISYFIIDNWLADFAYRIAIPYQIFPVNLIITIVIILITVIVQASKVITLNPTEVIRNE